MRPILIELLLLAMLTLDPIRAKLTAYQCYQAIREIWSIFRTPIRYLTIHDFCGKLCAKVNSSRFNAADSMESYDFA